MASTRIDLPIRFSVHEEKIPQNPNGCKGKSLQKNLDSRGATP
jgi:hypothetical protein